MFPPCDKEPLSALILGLKQENDRLRVENNALQMKVSPPQDLFPGLGIANQAKKIIWRLTAAPGVSFPIHELADMLGVNEAHVRQVVRQIRMFLEVNGIDAVIEFQRTFGYSISKADAKLLIYIGKTGDTTTIRR